MTNSSTQEVFPSQCLNDQDMLFISSCFSSPTLRLFRFKLFQCRSALVSQQKTVRCLPTSIAPSHAKASQR